MKDEIEYREFRDSDIPYIEEMFCRAFELDTYSKNKWIMKHLLANYIYSYLERESYIIIAEYKSIPVGFLIGNYLDDIKPYTKIKYRLLESYHKLFLKHLKAGKKYLYCKGLIDDTDEELIIRKRKLFDSELILFVVDDKMRGQGIGKEMLEEFKKYLIDNGGKNLYLYTDDFSDVDFYRRMKFKQEDYKIINLGEGEENSRFYLFSIPVSKIA